MSKKKVKTDKELLYEKNVGKLQDFQIPLNEKDKRYFRVTHYLINHINFKRLSLKSKVVLFYMYDWAFVNEEYIQYKTFDFSSTMLSRNKIMTNKTTIEALKELEYYGFIQKENNACKNSGMTQKWSFSYKWYNGEKSKYIPKKHIEEKK